jgi:hypothetical protein
MARNGPSFRGDRSCRARAASSFPAPVSPRTSTLTSSTATRDSTRNTAFIAGSCVHMPWKHTGASSPSASPSSSSSTQPAPSSGRARTRSVRPESAAGCGITASTGRPAESASATGRSGVSPHSTATAERPGAGVCPNSAAASGDTVSTRRSASSTSTAPASAPRARPTAGGGASRADIVSARRARRRPPPPRRRPARGSSRRAGGARRVCGG